MVTLAFKHQEQYEHVSSEVTRSQEGKDYKMEKRDYAFRNHLNKRRNGNDGMNDNNKNGRNVERGNDHDNLWNGNNKRDGNRYTYKEFKACVAIEFDGKGGALAYTRWVEKMESMIDISNCAAYQRVKYTTCSLTGKALT
ncbi:hypothetical protein Tco_0527058 [Tanacetum coccineum]